MDKVPFTVGQEVVLTYGLGWSATETITTVEKVSPTGRVRVRNSTGQFRPDGSLAGRDGWRRANIAPVTPEALDRMARAKNVNRTRELADKLYRTPWGSVPAGRLTKIVGLLQAAAKLSGGEP